MARAISTDLRQRVCEAISEGSSCRQAASRFKVSPSTAIRLNAQMRDEGDVAPKRQGGDRRSWRIEAHADFILAELAAKSDITLVELKAKLSARGLEVGIGTIWRFFDRRSITFKKNSARGRARA